MQIHQDVSLKPFNSFGIAARARYFTSFRSLEELQELSLAAATTYQELPVLVLGGGSNILFTQDYDGLVMKNDLKGIVLESEDSTHYFVKAFAGENWHLMVMFCIEHGYAGLENLSLIPGNTGAAPIQNIGAYGVEVKDVFYSLEAYDTLDHTLVTFKREDCKFSYRDSVFKGKYKNRFVIVSVTFKLQKTPAYNISYGAIQQELDRMGVEQVNIKAISDAVINIRRSKLPDPVQIGNAGSFFKNPVIPALQFEALKKDYPGVAAYANDDNTYKVAAGWLIEQCGWKGYRKGDAGCHSKQALVLVNYGNAQGLDIYSLSNDIMHSVEEKFGILLEREVNII